MFTCIIVCLNLLKNLGTIIHLSINHAYFNSLFTCLLITFANRLDPDQDQQNFVLYNPFDILIVSLKEFFEKVHFEKKSADHKKACKIIQNLYEIAILNYGKQQLLYMYIGLDKQKF